MVHILEATVSLYKSTIVRTSAFAYPIYQSPLTKAKNCRDSGRKQHDNDHQQPSIHRSAQHTTHVKAAVGALPPPQAPNIAKYLPVANWPVLKRYVVWIRIQRRYGLSMDPNPPKS